MRRTIVIASTLLTIVAAAVTIALAQLERIAPADDVSVYLIAPHPGEVFTGPFLVRFGLRGMGIAPAGIAHPNTGHHHLLINLPLDEVDLDAPLAFLDNTRHLGGGQTEVMLDLEPGTYTLQAMLADYRHIPFDPPVVSEVITIHVR